MSAATAKPTVLIEKQFDESFPLLTNHLNDNASFDGCMFETFGAELEFVRRQAPDCIWTYMDDDNGRACLSSGYHLVNRIGYVISTVPTEPGHDYFVPLEEPDCKVLLDRTREQKSKLFRVAFEQAPVHAIVVKALDLDTAIETAEKAFLEESGFFPEHPPAGWQRHFNDWEIVEAEEVQP